MQAVIVNRPLHSPTSNRALPKSNTQERPLKNFSGKTAFGPRVLAQVPGHGHRFEEFCPSRDKTHYKGSVTPTRLTSDSGSKRTGESANVRAQFPIPPVFWRFCDGQDQATVCPFKGEGGVDVDVS